MYYYYGHRAHWRHARLTKYDERMLSTDPAAYWPMDEVSGSTGYCLVNPAQNGSYTGVTLGQVVADGKGVTFTCPLFDGTNDYLNIYTPALATAFNGAAGTFAMWAMVYDLDTWTDSTTRKVAQLRVDVNNRVYIHKADTDNDVRFEYKAGGTVCGQNITGRTSVDWMHLAITWDKTANETIYYIDGAQADDDTGLGTWAGALSATRTIIGANSTTPDGVWYGWLAKAGLWTTAKSPAQIAEWAVV